jgi:hypothetical protein
MNRVATKAATTTMETTILTVVETVVILNVYSANEPYFIEKSRAKIGTFSLCRFYTSSVQGRGAFPGLPAISFEDFSRASVVSIITSIQQLKTARHAPGDLLLLFSSRQDFCCVEYSTMPERSLLISDRIARRPTLLMVSATCCLIKKCAVR